MSNVKFNLSNAEGTQTLAVTGTDDNGALVFNKIVTPANPSFSALVTYLVSTPEGEHDVEHVHGLVDPAVGIGRMLQEEFGDRVTFDSRHFYLDGIPEVTALARVVKDKVLGGDTDWKRFVRFMVRLDGNPSKRAKDAVWDWVEKHGVTITEDGRMVGYKGLVNGKDAVTGEQNVPVSHHRGPNNFIDGSLFGEAGVAYQVPHRLGTVISKRRSDVDDNASLACSTGLHVGAYSYAKTFGENRADGARYSTMGRMADSLPNSTFALVAFAPEDVVSVPEDGTSDWKIRVSRYEVVEFLEEVKDVLEGQHEYDVKTPAPFLPPGQEFQPEPTVEQPPTPIGQTEDETPSSDDDGNEYEDDVTEEPTSEPTSTWEIRGDDNMGTCVYETITGTEKDAQEVLEVHDPEGDLGYYYVEVEVEADKADEWLTDPEQAEIEEEQDEAVLVEPEKGTGLLGRVVLRDWAAVNPALARDLADTSIGHKALARKYAAITTEASVRRYRKAEGI